MTKPHPLDYRTCEKIRLTVPTKGDPGDRMIAYMRAAYDLGQSEGESKGRKDMLEQVSKEWQEIVETNNRTDFQIIMEFFERLREFFEQR